MISFSWDFQELAVKIKQNGLENVVYSVAYYLTGKENNFSFTVAGVCGLKAPEPDSFVPYNDLTESQVTSWVENAIGQETLNAHKKHITEQIELQKNPITASLPKPWKK